MIVKWSIIAWPTLISNDRDSYIQQYMKLAMIIACNPFHFESSGNLKIMFDVADKHVNSQSIKSEANPRVKFLIIYWSDEIAEQSMGEMVD